MPSVQLSVALATARTYLNDDTATVWSDATLIPKAQDVHRELQSMLWSVGSPVVRAVSAPIAIASGTTPTVVTLPTDLMTPFALVEYATSGGSMATAIPMTEVFNAPIGYTIGATLTNWWWQQETLTVNPANTNRTIVIFYRRQIPIPQNDTDQIGISFGELYMGAKTAAVAHGSLGNEAAYKILSEIAAGNFKTVVAAQRGQQTPPVKP